MRNANGEMVPLSTFVTRASTSAAPSTPCASTSSAPAEIIGAAAPGYSSGQALDGARGGRAADAAAGDGLRLERALLPGEGLPGRHAGGLRPVAGLRVPRSSPRCTRAGRCRSASCSARRSRCWARSSGCMARQLRQQRLRADRPGDAGRPRPRRTPSSSSSSPRCSTSRREGAGGRGARGGAAAPAAHPDDLVRVHLRLRAAVGRRGRGRGLAGGCSARRSSPACRW